MLAYFLDDKQHFFISFYQVFDLVVFLETKDLKQVVLQLAAIK